MRLTGAEIANSEVSKFAQDVLCPWCLRTARIELGPQHVTGDLTLHCPKCGKFSRHKTADKWFDQHQERIEELKGVWKKIPSDAYVSCRQSMRGSPFVYTISLGGVKRPEEFFSLDIVQDILTNEYGMSYNQAHGALMSAALTPGQRIYLQRHTRLVMAATEREEMKRTGDKEWVIATGTPVRVNGQEGLFLRYSANEGFAIVALPTPGIDGFGDAEVPVMDLEVVDAGGPDVAEDFLLDKEMDEGGQEVGGLEEALEHIEVAEEIVEDLVLEEGGPSESGEEQAEEHGEEHEEAEHEFEEDKGDFPKGEKEEGGGNPFAASRRQAIHPLLDPTSRPGMDPGGINQKLQSLQSIIQDPQTDPQSLAEAQRRWTELKRQVPASRQATTYKTKDDLEVSERPEHKTKGPKLTDTKFEQDAGWVPENEGKNPNPKKDKNLKKEANVHAQRRVHTHYTHSGDLKRAIEVNRDDLSIEDIRVLCKFYANTGKIAHNEADELAFWFIGDKPRLLCASDLSARDNRTDRDDDDDESRRQDEDEEYYEQRRQEEGKEAGKRKNDPCGQMGEMLNRCKEGDPDRKFKKKKKNAAISLHEVNIPPPGSILDRNFGVKVCPHCGRHNPRSWPSCPCESSQEGLVRRKPMRGSANRGRGALSLRDLRVSAKDAGEAEVPDAHPESGVSSGSGATSTPDPKRQTGESANSVTGPEKVRDHGSGNSPKNSGDVKAPDLGVPKGASMRRKADGMCQKCGTPLNQAGVCPTCNSGAEQQQAQGDNMAPTTALSKRDLRAAAHKPGCGCGFCSRMKENSDWSKGRKKEPKSALSARDVKGSKGVGIFMPALHKGSSVLVIAVDNTSLRATVQDGSGNQRQVDFADLEPVKTGPYSGVSRTE